MATVSEETTTICTHCDRPIPSGNIDLHTVHCGRNLEKCKVCGDMVPKKHAEEHYFNTHAPVACSLCSETMDREILDVHKGEDCPQRIVTCEYCEFPLPAIDLSEHQDICGNRTEHCYRCARYIRLRDRYVHETTCNGVSEAPLGTSRDFRPAAEREPRPRRRDTPAPAFPKRHLLITIAITGIAFILGSFFYQKKSENSTGH
ncbi:TRAF-type zinc finger domain-containing protein 1-like isoform X1 [Chenopodium quinoa]|uniref:TRAF-type zinc finger domain-containing protein 1-like isoform X1 n=1 Tax=Chenopodium quinoa TaxID=63459 RepID=UPI000B779C27|nr:TRAF-type zinc finger domain-containing protein 1-like isoform X1 [Chenopodium quinoa]